MSEHNEAKRSKTYRENKKKQKIDKLNNSCAIEQVNEKNYQNDGINEFFGGIIKMEPKEATPNEEDKLILELVENCSSSPASSPFYTVEWGGRAMINTKASLNLDRLKVEPVFTQESDESSTEQNNSVELVKQQKLLKEMESVTKSMQMSPSKLASQKRDSTKSNVTCNEKETDSITESTDQNYNESHRLNDYFEVDCFDLQPEIGNQILSIVKETNAIAHENKIKLDTLTKELDTIKKNQTTIINFLLNKQIVDIEPIDFKKMYNLEIPCKGLQDFQYFEKQLAQNELLKSDVITQLSDCIDKRDCSLTKSFANMLRLFITSNALSNFTAIRKSAKSDKNREIFITTNLYKLMSGIITKERRDKKLAHDNKDLHSALSDVISHSSKWNSS